MSAAKSFNAIAVTGLGVVSSIGNGFNNFQKALIDERKGINLLTRFDSALYKCKVAAEAEIENLSIPPTVKQFEFKRMDRFVKYALSAAYEALQTARFDTASPQNGLLAIGVGMGGLPHMEEGVERQRKLGPHFTSPYLIPSLIPNMAGSFMAGALNWNGLQLTIAAACASGTVAIGEAMHAIRTGRAKWALAGGTEAVITPITWSGFEAMRALTTGSQSRPFDTARDGMVPGEGAVMLVLEQLGEALKRKAQILGILSGYSSMGSAKAFIAPDVNCMQQVMEAALKDAGLKIPQAVIAQASGLVKGDKAEMESIRNIMGDNMVPITSIKGQVGHTFAASGPLNVAAAVACFNTNTLMRISGMQDPDLSSGPLNYCLNAVKWKPGPVLMPAYGFGGVHAALVISPDLSDPN